jgi:hypothetical protein
MLDVHKWSIEGRIDQGPKRRCHVIQVVKITE